MQFYKNFFQFYNIFFEIFDKNYLDYPKLVVCYPSDLIPPQNRSIRQLDKNLKLLEEYFDTELHNNKIPFLPEELMLDKHI